MSTEWDEWLARLTDAAATLERQLAAAEMLTFPALPEPPVSAGSGAAVLPAEYRARTAAILDRLERLERVAEAQRDRLHRQLSSLAAPRPRRTAIYQYEAGKALDIAG